MTLVGKQFGHYHILKLIGRGSMGEVYLIEDAQVHRQIAAKIIRIETMQPDNEEANNALRLFWREARVIARLDHPHILPLYDHGESFIDGAQIAYLMMPYRPEGSLIHWLRRRASQQQSRPLTARQAIHLIRQAGQALQYAHDHQVMHLDVKPANFLIRGRSDTDDYPDLLLSDFGIARLVHATSRESQQVRGTPIYMAPEQWASHPIYASDQYALAIMAYELLTGYPPFQGAPLSVMYAHTHHQPLPIHNLNSLLPSTIDPVLQKALAKKPEERFPSVAAFAQAFENAFALTSRDKSLKILHLLPLSESSAIDTLSAHRRHALPLPSAAVYNQATSQPLASQYMQRTAQEIHNLPTTTALQADMASHHAAYSTMDMAQQTSTLARRSMTLPPLDVYTPPKQQRLWLWLTLGVLFLFLLGSTGWGIYAATAGQKASSFSAKAGTFVSVHTHLPSSTTPILGQSWSLQPASPKALNNLLWLHSLFLALGSHGLLFTSSDGTTWKSEHSGSLHFLEGATWGHSLFVVVGDNGTILTSPDGHSWSSRHSGTSQNLYDVTWSGSLFLICGDNGTLLTSPDGIKWSIRTLANSPSLYAITWSDSLFVAIGDSGVVTSHDGITWRQPTSAPRQAINGLIRSDSLFVVVGDNGAIFSSRDGSSWSIQHAENTHSLSDIDWSGALFVAVGQSGTILTSPNGVKWTTQHPPTTQDIGSVACSNTRCLASEASGVLASA